MNECAFIGNCYQESSVTLLSSYDCRLNLHNVIFVSDQQWIKLLAYLVPYLFSFV